MRAMILEAQGIPLVEADLPVPEPGPGQIRVKVRACGVCRTDLHVLDGDLRDPKLPLVMGPQVVGTGDEPGEEVGGDSEGARIGGAWPGCSCGRGARRADAGSTAVSRASHVKSPGG